MAGDEDVTRVTSSDVTLPAGAAILRRLLDEDPWRTWTTKELASRLGVKRSSMKMRLSRYWRKGYIDRPDTGIYRSPLALVARGLPDPRLRLHALKAEARYQMMGGSFRDVWQRVSTVWASPTIHRHPKSHALTTTGDWEGRALTVTVHDNAGLIEVFLQSSSRPLELLMDVRPFFSTIATVTGIPAELWLVKQADWNIDLPGRLPTTISIGVGLSLAGLGNVVVKVYAKLLDLVRVEVRAFEELSLDALLAYIRVIAAALIDAYRMGPRSGDRSQVP